MYYKENFASQFGSVELIAEDFTSWQTPAGKIEVDVWGRLEGNRRPIYPPRNQHKSIAEHGGVDGYRRYLQTKEGGQLFFYVPLSAFLSFSERARQAFSSGSTEGLSGEFGHPR